MNKREIIESEIKRLEGLKNIIDSKKEINTLKRQLLDHKEKTK